MIRRVSIILLFILANIVFTSSTTRVIVYQTYPKPCPFCPYDEQLSRYLLELTDGLNKIGVSHINFKYIDFDLEARAELNDLYLKLSVPESMQGYRLVININDKFLFINTVSVEIITDFLMNHARNYQKLVVFKDELSGKCKVIDDGGNIKECAIENSIGECVEEQDMISISLSKTLPLIVISGLMDGINPCAFSVLLFFIAFIFITSRNLSWKQAKEKVLLIGALYITGVYLSYLMIGLAVVKAITITGFPHAIGKIGVILVIILGIINIKDYFYRNKKPILSMPSLGWINMKNWLRKCTTFSAFITGFLASLLEFPCTGGIYFAVLGMLAHKITFNAGIIYLIIYNIAFVIPLILILLLASNIRMREFSLEKWQKSKGKHIRLLSGLFMIAIGVLLLSSGLI